MKKWICILCGWIYDELLGVPEDGIKAGTAWADVPSDWLCPECGVGKEDFEMVELVAQDEQLIAPIVLDNSSIKPIVIIGTGMAGYNLAREFRLYNKTHPLIMITADSGEIYSKPQLSVALSKGKLPAELVKMSAGQLAKTLNVKVWTNTRVTNIDTANKTLEVEALASLQYEKLVFATGSEAIPISIGGNAQSLTYSVNDLDDYAVFRKQLDQKVNQHIVVVGAGLIGCEFANDMLNSGHTVSIVEMNNLCLGNLVPKQASQALHAALKEKGANFYFSNRILSANVDQNSGAISISLINGKRLSADLILTAVGVKARVDLARKANIKVNRGISVNRQLETSASDVFAIGDCAEVEGLNYCYVAPLLEEAKVLAKNLVKQNASIIYPAVPIIIKTPVCPIVTFPIKHAAGSTSEGSWQVNGSGMDLQAEFVCSSGNLLAFTLTGSQTSNQQSYRNKFQSDFE